jgi:hypothetical protein
MQMIFKTRHFNRWARKANLPDSPLCQAVTEIRQGLIDADLGGGIIKKRVALPGHGKRGSTRTLLATNRNDRWVFVFSELQIVFTFSGKKYLANELSCLSGRF